MKKQFLTLAVLAAVAIGGAVTQASADTFYSDGGSSYRCEGEGGSCVIAIGNQPVWPSFELSQQGDKEDVVQLSQYENLEFTP